MTENALTSFESDLRSAKDLNPIVDLLYTSVWKDPVISRSEKTSMKTDFTHSASFLVMTFPATSLWATADTAGSKFRLAAAMTSSSLKVKRKQTKKTHL